MRLHAADLAAHNADIAVVNLETIKAPIMHTLKEQVERLLENYRQEFSKYEKDLRQENQQILAAEKALVKAQEGAHDKWLEKRDAFEKKVLSVQRKAESRSKKLSEAHGEVLSNVNQLLVKVIKKVGEEKNLSIILPQSEVIYWVPKVDITWEVNEKLQRELSSLSLELKVEVDD